MIVLRKGAYRLYTGLNRVAARELRFMRRCQWLRPEEVESIQQSRLENLLEFAYRNTGFYRERFSQVGLFESGRLRLERFRELPTLDKPTIRKNHESLTSRLSTGSQVIENRTSGSTGEPLVVLQERDSVRVTGTAVLRLFYEWHGIVPGDPEIKLWGLERDLFLEARPGFRSVVDWASGIRMLNAFQMSPSTMRRYIRFLSEYNPRVLRGYSANLYELARFAIDESLDIVPPGIVVSSAGTLYNHLRQVMEETYGTGVFNHYGSREMHNMAMECGESAGLHVSALTHMIEIVDDRGEPCGPGVDGDLVVTDLTNRAMPLIRYRIGDRGVWADSGCSCGRGLPVLSRLTGRRVECFRTRDGKIVPGEFFIYLLAVHLQDNPIDKYQVLQEDYDVLRFRLVMKEGESLGSEIVSEIEDKTRLVMGGDCRSIIDFVEDIPLLDSGKYLYTKCELLDAR